MGIYITDLVAKPLVEITETINKIIEEEISFKNTMLSQLPFERLEGGRNTNMTQNEPAEISNFRKAMLGFKDVFERGAKKFDLENKKLKTYIDTMYEELDEINNRNLDFISTLSHDIRTPLTLIKGYARGLESGEVIDREMESKFKSGIVKSANDLENLIYNVLDFAYEVGDPGVLSKQTIDVKEAIDEIVFEISQFYKGESRKIDYKIDAFSADSVQGQGRVYIDLMNLNRVLINLINNSLKYSNPTDKVMLSIQNWRSCIYFEVYDSGQGIQTEEIEKITDIFYRTEASKNQKGYGLGLYISKQILQGHDIQLKIESEYGKYTKLSFEVPVIKKSMED
jgi:signal transduction histidine kinase